MLILKLIDCCMESYMLGHTANFEFCDDWHDECDYLECMHCGADTSDIDTCEEFVFCDVCEVFLCKKCVLDHIGDDKQHKIIYM